MKINKKGFTLIELLAVIGVLGLVLAISTYFIINSITGSKEKAFELSKKGLLDSAITYANEFNEEEDWVDAYPEYEYTCVNAWWLVNKGMQKKEIFTEDQNEKYKFKKSAVIVLERNKDNKVIENAYLPENNEKECKNTLSAEINLTSTYNSITVTGTCKMKGVIQNDENDIEYRFCKTDDNTCVDIPNNKYTFSGLIHNTNYNFSLQCSSKKYGNSSVIKESKETLEVPAPSVNCNYNLGNNVEVIFNDDDDTLIKEVKIEGTNVKYNNTTISNTTIPNTTTTIEPFMYFNISDISSDYAKFIATVKADENKNNKVTTEATCPKYAIDLETLEKPFFVASDKITSNNWHTKTFNLEISSYNKAEEVYYLYGTDQNNLEKYTNQITVNSNEITYYAKACSKNDPSVCSEISTYVAKIDRNPPIVTIKLYKTSNDNNSDSISSDNYSFQRDTSLPWLPYNVSIHYDFSDAETGIDTTTAQFKYNYEFQKELDDTVELVNDNISLGRYVTSYNRSIGLDGDRKVYFKICDKAGNCSDKYTYFRTDTQKPIIYKVDDKVTIGCTTLSGIKDSVMYQDGNKRYGFVSKDYKTDDYQTPSNGTITHSYNDADIYASCTNKAGICSKVKITKSSTLSQGCYYSVGYYAFDGPAASTTNMCYTSQIVGGVCGNQKIYTNCTVVDKSFCGNIASRCVQYKAWYVGSSVNTSFVLEEQPSC